MTNIQLYEIDPEYIKYLSHFAPHLFKNKQIHQQHERKYIGIVLSINNCDYFAPLSSFKEKHKHIHEGLDFIKIKNYAVINLNNMFPAPLHSCSAVNISQEKDWQYRNLLLAEYRFIHSIQQKIYKNALTLYNLKIKDGTTSKLTQRCNDFLLLEEKMKFFKHT